jgi:signal transduction histidine kinase
MYEGRDGGVSISLDLQDNLPVFSFDSEQIKRVLVNLIENAIESYDESATKRPVSISSRIDKASEKIVLEVSDSGRGIAPENMRKLFQPYFSTKGRGTGLGLAIVRRIVSEHDGRIYAASNGQNGSRFIIELPVHL